LGRYSDQKKTKKSASSVPADSKHSFLTSFGDFAPYHVERNRNSDLKASPNSPQLLIDRNVIINFLRKILSSRISKLKLRKLKTGVSSNVEKRGQPVLLLNIIVNE